MNIKGITRTKTGYRIRVRRRAPDGRVVDRVCTLALTTPMAELVAAREALIAEIEGGLAPVQAHSLGEYIEVWLSRRVALRGMGPQTIEANRHQLARTISPQLLAMPVAQITRQHVQVMADRLVASGYARSTIKATWQTTLSLLRDLAADHDLPDPTRRVYLPRVKNAAPPREKRALTLAQLRTLLDATQIVRPLQYTTICVMALTGARIGEAQGLCWDRVDLEVGVVVLNRRWIKSGRRLDQGTKTGAGRVMPLHPRLKACLVGLCGAERPRAGLVCPGEVPDQPWSDHAIRAALREAAQVAGVGDLTPHDLRRTYNTVLLRSGVPDHVVRALVGHASEVMTQLYYKPSQSDLEEATDHLEV